MDFKIVDVFELDCHLIVKVEHFHRDGSFWFQEHYKFQGREGLKHKRRVNGSGRLLMDNGQVAPQIEGALHQHLPEGRDWIRHVAPHLEDNSITDTIKSIHKQRLVSGWPQGCVDHLARTEAKDIIQEDRDGCEVLVTTFSRLIGVEV